MAPRSKPTKGFGALRTDFLKRIGKSKQWLSAEAKKENILDVKVAQALVARRHGMRLQKYLQGADLEKVQQAMATNGARVAPAPAAQRGGRVKLAAKAWVIAIGKEFKASFPLLSTGKLTEAKEMAAVYPFLFVLENSVRDIIKRVMQAKYGENWWDTQLTSAKAKDVKSRVEQKLAREDEQSWHQGRGKHKIDYTTLGELKVIAASNQALFFPDLLGTKTWFDGLIDELEPSRNVLCHMNPLTKENADLVKLRFGQWQRHLVKRETDLSTAMTPP
jgi:HEPN superfamily Swt1-like protein